MTQPRLDRLTASLSASNLDAVILNPGPTLKYLTGVYFHLLERPVVLFVSPGKDPVLVLPGLELPKLDLFPYKVRGIPYSENPVEWDDAFRTAAQALGLEGKRIGVEPRHLRLLEFRHVKAGAPEADFPDATDILAELRLRKDKAEVESMRRAVRIAQEALEAVIPKIRLGMTEREIASRLTMELLRHGSDAEIPFSPIVSAGPNSANPHASPTDRELQAGDMLVIDWGAACDG